jgi:hypothetical protein
MKNLYIAFLFIFMGYFMQNVLAQNIASEFSGTWHGTPNTPFPERMIEKVWFENNQVNYELRESPDALPHEFAMQIVKVTPQENNPYGVFWVKGVEYNDVEYFTCFLYRNKQDNQIELTKFFFGIGLLVKKNTLAELENEIKNPVDDINLLDEIAEVGWQIFLSPPAYQVMLALPDFPLDDKSAYIKVYQVILNEIKNVSAQIPKKEIDPGYAHKIILQINYCKIMREQGYNCTEKSMGQFNGTSNLLYDKNDKDYLKLLKEQEKLLGYE